MSDALEIITTKKIPVFMTQGYSWMTGSGTEFTREQPYQMLDGAEAMTLIKEHPDRFKYATIDEVKSFFKVQ